MLEIVVSTVLKCRTFVVRVYTCRLLRYMKKSDSARHVDIECVLPCKLARFGVQPCCGYKTLGIRVSFRCVYTALLTRVDEVRMGIGNRYKSFSNRFLFRESTL